MVGNSIISKTSDVVSKSLNILGIVNPSAASPATGYGPFTLSAVYDGTTLASADNFFLPITSPPAQVIVNQMSTWR